MASRAVALALSLLCVAALVTPASPQAAAGVRPPDVAALPSHTSAGLTASQVSHQGSLQGHQGSPVNSSSMAAAHKSVHSSAHTRRRSGQVHVDPHPSPGQRTASAAADPSSGFSSDSHTTSQHDQRAQSASQVSLAGRQLTADLLSDSSDAAHTSHTSQHDQWTHSHLHPSELTSSRVASSTPWLLPRMVRLPYEGFHNDLHALLRMQRTGDHWVTVFMFSSGVAWWAMNAVHSYIRYGKSTSYIMAAPDSESLAACMQLRLPCLNMSAAGVRVGQAATGSNTSQAHGWRSDAYYALVWAKVELVAIILRTGHHVHFSDVDVVFLREVWPSYRHVFKVAGPDAVFMQEQWQVPGRSHNRYVNLFNTGVYSIRANARSLGFMTQWYGSGSQRAGNQPYINAFIPHTNASFALCNTALECNMVRRSGRAALLLHLPQSDLAACPPPASEFLQRDNACSDERLFIHYICSPKGWGVKGPGSKGSMLDGHKLRLLDTQGRPLYGEEEQGQQGAPGGHRRQHTAAGAGRRLLQEQGASHALRPHPFLPCAEHMAWRWSIPQLLDQSGRPFKVDPADDLPVI